MGRKCFVPGCHSNYCKEPNYTSVFSFPSEPERRKLWIRNINRKDLDPNSKSVVCVKHFEDRFVIREDRLQHEDGSEWIVARRKLSLTCDAYPTIFENLTSDVGEKSRKGNTKKLKVTDSETY